MTDERFETANEIILQKIYLFTVAINQYSVVIVYTITQLNFIHSKHAVEGSFMQCILEAF